MLGTTLCDRLLVTCDRSVVFSGTLVSSTNKTDHHDITEILLKVALNTINHNVVTKIKLLVVFSTKKTDLHHITDILLKVSLNIRTLIVEC